MLIGDDIKDGADYNEDSLFFSLCKALYIDYDNLIPYKTNQRNFVEFYKPKELVMQNFYFKSFALSFINTIILTDDWLSND